MWMLIDLLSETGLMERYPEYKSVEIPGFRKKAFIQTKRRKLNSQIKGNGCPCEIFISAKTLTTFLLVFFKVQVKELLSVCLTSYQSRYFQVSFVIEQGYSMYRMFLLPLHNN